MWLVSSTSVPGNLPFRLEEGDYLIGRTKKSQIVIADATISRRHARLVSTHGNLMIEDLHSSNGTFVNDVPVTNQLRLQIGDRLCLGMVNCLFSRSPLLVHALGDDECTYQVPLRPTDTTQVKGLTPSQQAIIPYLMEGRSETEIATRMHKSRHTIHTHMKAMFERLGVHSREELIVKLLRKK